MPVATRFYDYGLLYEHFYNHGADFGATDEYDYQDKARNFLKAALSDNPDIQECTRRSSEVVRFNRVTDEFAVMRYDGVIETYYKPIPRRLAPPGTPLIKTHSFSTNDLYFKDNCLK